MVEVHHKERIGDAAVRARAALRLSRYPTARLAAAVPLECEACEALEARGGPQPGVLGVAPVPREGPAARAGDLLPPGVQPLVTEPHAGEEPDPRPCRGCEEEPCEPGLLDD